MSISVDSSSLRVEKVVFQGDALVAESTATQLTTDVFNAKTLDQILSASIKSAQQLSDLGISKSCNIQLDFHDDLVTVNMNLIKNSTLSINVGTSISTQSADLTAQLSIKNMSGRGDDLSLSVSQDTSLQDTLTHPTQLNAGKTFVGLLDYPVNADPFTRFQIAASSQSKNQNEISSHAQQNTQLSLKYLMLNRNAGNIEVETGVSLRNNHSIHKDASWRYYLADEIN